MIIGTGIDLVDIPRFERTVARTPRLMQRLFAPSEQALRLASLAARYAAKEALIKALGGSDGVHWTEIEIASEPSGRPYFVLSGSTAAVVAERGIATLHLSLTHDAGLAAAYVVAEGSADNAARPDTALPAGSAETPSERRDPLATTPTEGGLDGGGGRRIGAAASGAGGSGAVAEGAA
ncbi:Holo-(acyl-carrier-protein) synthase [Microbacterium sp. 8M]|nr:Holo-(acyl-carrier-protein) synthase [Microbacterium sp. 8M]